MTRNEILRKLAPCGLDCSRCASFKDGEISKQSAALLSSLDNYKRMADKMSSFFEPFFQYDSFEKILSFFADAACEGCRGGSSKCLPSCEVKRCFREMEMDFCGECSEFPCDNSGFKEDLYQRWLENGETIKERGVEEYWSLQAKRSRY